MCSNTRILLRIYKIYLKIVESIYKSAISGSLSRKGCTPWLFLGVASWMRESKLAAGMARLVLNVLAGLVLVLNLLMVNVIVEAGTHLDEPWFRWREGVVPFYFQARLHICYPSIEGRKKGFPRDK